MQEFHDNGRIVKDMNSLIIILIPKNDNHISIHDFRHISLIGGLYKII